MTSDYRNLETQLETLSETENGSPFGSSGVFLDGVIPDPVSIGPYRILERLGSGGMGLVYLAEQIEPVERRVAIKVMRSTFADSEAKARFEAERQAMARLQHPHVAQIFAAESTEDGRPYFVMEHVDGRPIVHFCDEQRLSLEERLLLFCDVCAGVQHAHQKGIIHRDLKPSNILVAQSEGRPIPKIIDFGIAKALDRPLSQDALVTGDRLIGTPAYLSPEAARVGERLDLDTRTDVFSLGILLYELLVGHRPFDDENTNLLQVLQRIAVEEPSGPSARWSGLDVEVQDVVAQQRHLDPTTLHRTLKGDLDWIVLKAIAKDREQRYGSSADLAQDIHRYLKHEPLEAGPPSPIYRIRKFVRRRLGTVVSALLLISALVAGFTARTLEADRANREAAAAIEARRQTEIALGQAQRAEAEAAQVSQFLIDLFNVSDPGQARGSSVTARELLDAAAEKIRGDLADQPLARARLMHTMAEVYRKLGLFDQAGILFDEALALRRGHLPRFHLDISESINGKAALLAMLGQSEAALPLARESLEIRERALGKNHYRVALSLMNLGNVYTDLDRFDEAEPLLLRAVKIAEAYEGPPIEDMPAVFNNLASLYVDQGRHSEAEPILHSFLEHLEAIHGADHPWIAFGLENLGEVAWQLGDVAQAHEHYGKALPILKKAYGDRHPEVGWCLVQQGELFAAEGRWREARDRFEQALRIYRSTLPEDHPYLEEALEGLASLEAPQ